MQGVSVSVIKTEINSKIYWRVRVILVHPTGSIGCCNVPVTLAPNNFGRSWTGGVPNWGVSHFFRERSGIVSRTLSGLFLVGAWKGREGGKGRIGKSPKNRESPRKEVGSPKNDNRGRTSPGRETPPFETLPFIKNLLMPPFLNGLFCRRFSRGKTAQ